MSTSPRTGSKTGTRKGGYDRVEGGGHTDQKKFAKFEWPPSSRRYDHHDVRDFELNRSLCLRGVAKSEVRNRRRRQLKNLLWTLHATNLDVAILMPGTHDLQGAKECTCKCDIR